LKPPLLSKDGSVHVTDEFYNTLLSSVGIVISLIGCAFLLFRAHQSGSLLKGVGFSIYGFGLIAMFTTSALHHGVNGSPETNHFLRQLDYYAIFIMIAGSFTPFCLLLLNNSFGRTILGLVWALSVMGIILKMRFPHVPRGFILSLYIGMGWLGVLIAKPIYQNVEHHGFLALVLGGFFYTVGGIVFGLEKPNPFPGRFGFHEIWHCFVVAGAASHFYIMYRCL